MYKNEGLLLYVIAVLYFVLLRIPPVKKKKTNNIFYERFLIYTLSLYPFTPIATTSVQNEMETRKSEKKISGAILIFLFLYELYRKVLKKIVVPFHQCQLFVVCVDFEREKQNSKSKKNVVLLSF